MAKHTDRVTRRRQAQLSFEASGKDIRVGRREDLPLPLERLKAITPESPEVVQSFGNGLTAHVHRIRAAGRDWTLKLKRAESRVRNPDGQTSFLNEVQRRRDFTRLKGDSGTAANFRYIVETTYAGYRDGVILSPWIEGGIVDHFDERIIGQILFTGSRMETAGLMEWDYCPGNILDDGERITLFDFGYCYPFDPLTEFNSNGTRDPMFHCVERFETRSFFGHLLTREQSWPRERIMKLFALEKELAAEAFEWQLTWLRARSASAQVLEWKQGIVDSWRRALASPSLLDDLFLVESYRSHVLDVHDDLSGQSCTPMTLRRIDKLENMVSEQFGLLKAGGALLFGDQSKSQQELLATLGEQRRLAEEHQLR
jgi:hypothetical protein